MGLDTKLSVLIFVFVLIAYTAQTLLAQYVQQEIHYRKPYFLLYLTHSGYVLLLPLHLLAFYFLRIPIDENLSILRGVLRIQYGPDHGTSRHHMKEEILPSSSVAERSESRPGMGRSLSRASLDSRPHGGLKRRTSLRRLLGKRTVGEGRKMWKWRLWYTTIKLTILIATPALLWYSAVPMTSMTDITAIYNTFAFWAGLLAIKFLGEKPTKIKLASVLLATLGVFVIAYGDAYLSAPIHKDPPITDYPPEGPQKRDENPVGSERFIGNLLALAGSIAYAYYEVWYALKVALPTTGAGLGSMDVDEEEDEEVAEGLLNNVESGAEDSNISNYTNETSSSATITPNSHSLRPISVSSVYVPPRSVTHPSPTTFLLYSNLLTTLIGLATLTLLWIPIPFLHWLGWEIFELPPVKAQLAIVGIILSGVCFNGGFMVLLSAWGPVMASVGNLCTLVLVAVADSVFPPHNVLSLWSAIGSGMVVGAFVLLVIGGHGDSEENTDYEDIGRD